MFGVIGNNTATALCSEYFDYFSLATPESMNIFLNNFMASRDNIYLGKLKGYMTQVHFYKTTLVKAPYDPLI